MRAEILDQLPKEPIKDALEEALIGNSGAVLVMIPSPFTDRLFKGKIDDEKYFGSNRNWISLHKFMAELIRPNVPAFWFRYLADVNEINPELLSSTGRKITFWSRESALTNIFDISTRISLNNINFFELALQYFGMAAMLGREFPNFVTFTERERSPIFKAAEAAGLDFGRPVRKGSRRALYERLTHLYPAGESGQIGREGSALRYLVDNQGFEQEHYEGAGMYYTVGCPAKKLTTHILEAYGDILQTRRYRDIFMDRVFGSSFSGFFTLPQ